MAYNQYFKTYVGKETTFLLKVKLELFSLRPKTQNRSICSRCFAGGVSGFIFQKSFPFKSAYFTSDSLCKQSSPQAYRCNIRLFLRKSNWKFSDGAHGKSKKFQISLSVAQSRIGGETHSVSNHIEPPRSLCCLDRNHPERLRGSGECG